MELEIFVLSKTKQTQLSHVFHVESRYVGDVYINRTWTWRIDCGEEGV